MRIEPFGGEDLRAVVALLREALPVEPITEAGFARRVLLDPNFDPYGALTAQREDGKILGFLLALTRRYPLEEAPDDRARGWITLFGVAAEARRQGLGGRLLEAAETWLRAQGRSEVWISPYSPNYWTPGVDEAAYPEALRWLQRRGYTTLSRPLSMDTALVGGWAVPPWAVESRQSLEAEGLQIVPFEPRWILPLSDFLRREFPGDWQRYLRETMGDIVARRRPVEELWLAVEAGRLLGFAQSEGERFGPFGVAASERGRGIGAALLFQMLTEIRARGLHNAWFLWTNDATADRLYRAAGFRETRRYSILRKAL
jgi:mycothiol synthase